MPAASPEPDPAARLAALGLGPPVPARSGLVSPAVGDGFVGGWVPEQPAVDLRLDVATVGGGAMPGPAAGSGHGGHLPGGVATAVASARGRHARSEPAASSLVTAILDRLPYRPTLGEPPSAVALLTLLGVCLGCVLLTAVALLHGRGRTAYAGVPSAPHSFAPLPSPTPPSIVVDVGGRVRRPGLVTLPLGSRVADALRAAGGALRAHDLLSLNLAAKVADGQLLLVGVPGAPATGGGAAAGSSGPLDLNSATAEQLDALPGIGPVLAQHILDWRTAHGGFRSVDQLRDVSGIGDSTFADLAPLVTV